MSQFAKQIAPSIAPQNKKVYEATQHQRKLEREIRTFKKQQAAAMEVGDVDSVKMLQRKLDDKYAEINNFCDKNGLQRDYSRELVSEQIIKQITLSITKREK